MTKIYFSVFSFLLLFSLPLSGQEGFVLECTIKDTNEAYVMLAHVPRMRGNLNVDGFRSIGTRVNAEGVFRLGSKKMVNGANYRLFFPKHYISLILCEGDSLQLDLHLTDPKQNFARGRGAGKFNVLQLSQLQYEYFDLERERGLEDFVNYIDSVITYQLSLLEAIYSGQADHSLVKAAPNQADIERIITYTPLSPEEYELLRNRVQFQRYGLLTNFLARNNTQASLGSVSIDFEGAAFRHFDQDTYRHLKHITDWSLYNALESIVQIEYLRAKQKQNSLDLTYGNWRSALRADDYLPWVSEFLKGHFDQEIFNRYYTEYVTGMMTWGMDYKTMLDYVDLEQDNKYVHRIQGFRHLLEHGLDDNTYGLSQSARNLDQRKFNDLLNTYNGTPLLLVFWSAQAAGASIIDELPSLRIFAEDYKNKISVIYICVDKQENKNLWAARIIDESWNGEHFFLPIEENKTTLHRITDQDISTLCSGGATYSFIDENGRVRKEIPGPFHLGEKGLEELYR